MTEYHMECSGYRLFGGALIDRAHKDQAMFGYAQTGTRRRAILTAWLPGCLVGLGAMAGRVHLAGHNDTGMLPRRNFPQETSMYAMLKNVLAVAGLAVATQAAAQVSFYEREGFEGGSITTTKRINNFERIGFNDRASSVVVQRDRWEVCDDVRFGGRCVILRPGRYPSLAAMGLNNRVSSARIVNKNARIDDHRYAPPAVPVASQIAFYERDGFEGRSFATEQQIGNFERVGFNDRASSAVVLGDRWEVCEDARFSGRCVILRPGRYPSLDAMGLNNRVSSAREVGLDARVDDHRYAPPPPAPVYDSRRRNEERVYVVNVTSVRAVLGTPGQRCWVEREQLPQQQSRTNVPAAIAGALVGGILGHQVGGGTGKDIATAGGAVAGAMLGANIGRDGNAPQAQTRDVQRCENVPSQARPDYWDVTYNFRGHEHRVQMTAPPGPTVTVNEHGEPRQ